MLSPKNVKIFYYSNVDNFAPNKNIKQVCFLPEIN